MSEETRFVVFDCDGTLVDSGHNVVAAMQGAFESENLNPPSPNDVRHQIGLHLIEAIANLYPAGAPETHLRMTQTYKDIATDHHLQGVATEPLYPGCIEVLRALVDEGAVLGVATGKSRRGLDRTLANHGIAGLFTNLKTADDGPGKPNPAILQDAMAEVGANPWNTVVIGDTMFDMALAVNAQAHAVGVSWGYHAPDSLAQAGARAVAESYADVPGLLQMIWGR